MKKICFIYFAGNELFMKLLNDLPNEKNNEFYYITNFNCQFVPKSKIKTIKLEFFYDWMFHFGFKGNSLGWFKDLYTNLNKIKPDILIVNDIMNIWFWQCLFFKILNPKTKLILYTEIQNFPKNKILKLITYFFILSFKLINKKVSKVITFTQNGKKFLHRHIKNEIEFAPVGIDINLFKPRLKNRKFLKDNILNLLIIARMVEYKNYFDILNALNYIKKNSNKKVILNIRGEGPLLETIKNKVNELNLQDNIKYLKKIPYTQIYKYYEQNDILILPSTNEAIGMVIPEALACGTPTISSNTVGANCYVKPGITSQIFKTNNYLELAEKILFMHDKKRLEKYSKNSIQNIQKNFNSKKISLEFLKKINI